MQEEKNTSKTSSGRVKDILETKKGKTYTVLIGTILAVMVMFLVAIRPAWVSITDKLAENNAKREYIEDADQKISDLQTLDNLYTENITAVNYLNTFLSEDPEEPYFYENLLSFVDESGVQFSALTVNRPDGITEEGFGVSQPFVASINVNLNTRSDDADSLLQLLELIEDSEYGFNVRSFSYRLAEIDNDEVGRWAGNYSFSYYMWDINNLRTN